MNFRRLDGLTLIGFAGNIGSGKTAAAAMVPGAHALQWADAIYRGLAAIFDVREEVLRDRLNKEQAVPIAGIEVVPRHLARTLGTEWGRDMIHPHLWVALTAERIAALATTTACKAFTICGTRFINELCMIHSVRGEVWWIDRPGTATGPHSSDRTLAREHCDRVIVNDGTLDQLRLRVAAAYAAYQEKRSCLDGYSPHPESSTPVSPRSVHT